MRFLILFGFCAGIVFPQKPTEKPIDVYKINCKSNKVSYMIPKNQEMEDLFQSLDFKENVRCYDEFIVLEFSDLSSLRRFILSHSEEDDMVRMEEGILFVLQYKEFLEKGIVFLHVIGGKAIVSLSVNESVLFDFMQLDGKIPKGPKGVYRLLVHRVDPKINNKLAMSPLSK